jgi:hypothetical protein
VVFYGTTIAVLLTLFVVPAVYSLVAGEHRSPQHLRSLIARLRSTAPRVGPEGADIGPGGERA